MLMLMLKSAGLSQFYDKLTDFVKCPAGRKCGVQLVDLLTPIASMVTGAGGFYEVFSANNDMAHRMFIGADMVGIVINVIGGVPRRDGLVDRHRRGASANEMRRSW